MKIGYLIKLLIDKGKDYLIMRDNPNKDKCVNVTIITEDNDGACVEFLFCQRTPEDDNELYSITKLTKPDSLEHYLANIANRMLDSDKSISDIKTSIDYGKRDISYD